MDHDEDNSNKVSNLHMTYGQFLDHDMSLSNNPGGCKNPTCKVADLKYPCFPIIKSRHQTNKCFKFTRSFATCKNGVREQNNIITSYLDCSMVYGNNKKRQKRVRDENGLLKITPSGLLPPDLVTTDDCHNREGGCYLAGDGRVNEHVGLVGFHTIFVRLHNHYAKKLAKLNYLWCAERIYQEARRIVIAVFQHITYTEYVPTLTDIKRYRGYNKKVDPRIPNVFSTVAFRCGHSKVKNSWGQCDHNFNEVTDNIPLRQTYFNNTIIEKYGIERTMFGLIANKSEAVDTKFAACIAKHLFIAPHSHGFQNLLALNIQRGRDHGIRGYNEWRKYAGLGAKNTFAGFKREIKDQKVRLRLKKLFKKTSNHIDLFPAGIAEKPTNGKLVGPTFQYIIKKTFENLRDGDRYWYESRKLFSFRQITQIRKMTMSKVLCLTLKGIVSVQRHPFFAFGSHKNRRVVCDSIPEIDIRSWNRMPRRYRYGRGFYRNHYRSRWYKDEPFMNGRIKESEQQNDFEEHDPRK